MRTRSGAFTLVELLVALALAALLATIGVPKLLDLTGRVRVRSAAYQLSSTLRLARSLAIRRGVRVGVKFRTEGRVSFGLYRDGDGDGLRTADIESGVDPPETPASTRHRLTMGADVRFGFPPGRPPRDPGNPRRRLGNLQDPVRFNRSDIASFSPLGASTPGSLYLTDGRHLAVVRLFGRTGKVKILLYDRKSETWR